MASIFRGLLRGSSAGVSSATRLGAQSDGGSGRPASTGATMGRSAAVSLPAEVAASELRTGATSAVLFKDISNSEIALDVHGRFYTTYLLQVISATQGTRQVAKRYAQFRTLHTQVRALPASQRPARKDLPRLTSKKVNGMDEQVILKRVRKLTVYLLELQSLAGQYPRIRELLQRFLSADRRRGDEDEGDDAEEDAEDGEEVDSDAEAPSGGGSGSAASATSASASSSAGGASSVASSSSARKCRACSRPLAVETPADPATDASSQAGRAASSGSGDFCSPQCQRFFSALSSYGMQLVDGRIAPSAGDSSAAALTVPSSATATTTTTTSSSRALSSAVVSGVALTPGMPPRPGSGGRRGSGDLKTGLPPLPVTATVSASASGSSGDGGLPSSRGRSGSLFDSVVSLLSPHGTLPGAPGAASADRTSKSFDASPLDAQSKTASITSTPSAAADPLATTGTPEHGDRSLKRIDSMRFRRASKEPRSIRGLTMKLLRNLTGNHSNGANGGANSGNHSAVSTGGSSFHLVPISTAIEPVLGPQPAQTTPGSRVGTPGSGPEGTAIAFTSPSTRSMLPPVGSGSSTAAAVAAAAAAHSSSGATALQSVSSSASLLAALSASNAANSAAEAHEGDGRIQRIIYSGLLWKQGAVHKSWKVRRIELRERSLFYYRTSVAQLLGSMRLIKSPAREELLHAAAYVIAAGVQLSSPAFPSLLFSQLHADGYFFASVAALPTELSAGSSVTVGELEVREEDYRSLPVALLRTPSGPLLAAVHTPERVLLVGCENLAEFGQWIAAIRNMVANEQQRLLAIVKAFSSSVQATAIALFGAPRSSEADNDGGLEELAGGTRSAHPTGGASQTDTNFGIEAQHVDSRTEVDGPGTATHILLSSPLAVKTVRSGSGEDMVHTPTLQPRAAAPSPVVAPTAATASPSLPAPSGTASIVSSRPTSFRLPVAASAASLLAPMSPIADAAAATASGSLTRSGGLTRQSSTAGGGGAGAPATSPLLSWEISEDEVEISEQIGSGSYGEVYRGRLWGSEVAVKILNADTVTADVMDSLKAEISILSQLRHPNVVLYMGANTTSANVFIVTEWAERGSLHSLLYDRAIPLSAASRLALALQTARGMCYLHSPRRKIIHRDLKSHNLLVTRDFTVKVADFGLTIMRSNPSSAAASVGASSHAGKGSDSGSNKLSPASGAPPIPPSTSKPSSGEEGAFYGVQGTPQWMAPEVLEGQKYTSSVDVYSFGVVLCELMARIQPYSDKYKRFDFVDAVLEEGAMPTIPRWCGALTDAHRGGRRGSTSSDGLQHGSGYGDDDSVAEEELEQPTAVTAEGLPWAWQHDTAAAADVASEGGFVMVTGSVTPSSAIAASAQPHEATALGTRSRASSENAPGSATGVASASKPGAGSNGSASTALVGGIDEWYISSGECTGSIKLLIEACLSRDSDSRPTFEELTLILTTLLERPPAEVFMQLELPRLREALAYGDDLDAAVAANEIMHAAAHALFAAAPHIPSSSLSLLGLLHTGSAGGSAGGIEEEGGRTENEAREPLLASNRGRIGLRPRAAPATARSAHSSMHTLGRKFPADSVVFLPVLPFAPQPSPTLSQMSPLPVIDLETALAAAPELLSALAAKLRANDLHARARLSLPVRCADLPAALKALPLIKGFVTVRDTDASTPAATSQVTARPVLSIALQGVAGPAAAAEIPTAAPPAAATAAPAPAVAAAAPTAIDRRAGLAAKNAAKAAAAKEEEEKRKRKAAVAATSQCVHALLVLVQVMDAGLPRGTGSDAEDSAVGELPLNALAKLALPPAGTADRPLLQHASRIIYSLATIICTCTLAAWESSFITRPTGGSVSSLDGALRWQPSNPAAIAFPQLPDYGADALVASAEILRDLWRRFPLLRTPIAHILTVTALAVAQRLGTVQVLVHKAGSSSVSVGATPAKPFSTASGADGPGAQAFHVDVPEEVIQSRYFGVVLERLRGAFSLEEAALLEGPRGSGGASASGVALGPGSEDGATGSSSVNTGPASPYRVWLAICEALEARLRSSTVTRRDGIILAACDVERFDAELC